MAAQFAIHAPAPLAALTLVFLAFRWRGPALSCGLATLFLLALIRLHTSAPTHWGNAGEGERFTLVHYNAFASSSRNDDAFAAWLRDQDADIVVIVDSPWRYVDAQAWIKDQYPHRIEPDPYFRWPITVLSKFPLHDAAELHQFPMDVANAEHSFAANRAPVVELPGGGRFLLSGMHPPSPRSAKTWALALRITEREAVMLRSWRDKTGLPVLVSGDFNSTPTGRLHQLFARRSGLESWTPWFRFGTWPADISPWFSVPIDRVWTSEGFTVRSITVGPRFASDHRPLTAIIEFHAESGRVRP